MNFLNKTRRLVTVGCLTVFVGACSSDGSNERAVRALGNFIAAPFSPVAKIRIPPNRPYIVLAYGGGRTPMSLISENNGIAQYDGPGGVQMTLHNGLLARLRGLGQEYEALYPIENGPYRDNLLNLARLDESVTRVVEYWIDQDPRRDRLRCQFQFEKPAQNLKHIVESCSSLQRELEIKNEYWVDNQGRIIRSRQWFHPKALHVDIEHRRVTPP